MAIIQNKWFEKESRKKELLKATAPAYEQFKIDDAIPFNGRHVKRFTIAARANLVKTLRGVRK